MKHVNERFQAESKKEVLLMCIGITSGVGRLLFGRIADYVPGVKKVYLQVLSLVLSPSKLFCHLLARLFTCFYLLKFFCKNEESNFYKQFFKGKISSESWVFSMKNWWSNNHLLCLAVELH